MWAKRQPAMELRVSVLYVGLECGSQGNRMWNFAFGLYLVVLAEKQLRLTAIYGFLMGISVLLFGGPIGNWVDRTNRRTGMIAFRSVLF